MTRDEAMADPIVRDLVESAKAELLSQIGDLNEAKDTLKKEKEIVDDQVKELETKLASAEGKVTAFEAEKAEKRLAAYTETEISKLEISDKAKELLKKRVTGKTEEEIGKSLTAEIAYLKEAASDLLKKVSPVKGVPPQDAEAKVKEKTDEEILSEGEKHWDTARDIVQADARKSKTIVV